MNTNTLNCFGSWVLDTAVRCAHLSPLLLPKHDVRKHNENHSIELKINNTIQQFDVPSIPFVRPKMFNRPANHAGEQPPCNPATTTQGGGKPKIGDHSPVWATGSRRGMRELEPTMNTNNRHAQSLTPPKAMLSPCMWGTPETPRKHNENHSIELNIPNTMQCFDAHSIPFLRPRPAQRQQQQQQQQQHRAAAAATAGCPNLRPRSKSLLRGSHAQRRAPMQFFRERSTDPLGQCVLTEGSSNSVAALRCSR